VKKRGRIGNKKAFCVLEFAKTESIMKMQLQFRTKCHTEPPMDKIIRERYKKYQDICALRNEHRL
jgi:hypothetical protein